MAWLHGVGKGLELSRRPRAVFLQSISFLQYLLFRSFNANGGAHSDFPGIHRLNSWTARSEAVSVDGWQLRNQLAEFRGDPHVVLAAVKNNGARRGMVL